MAFAMIPLSQWPCCCCFVLLMMMMMANYAESIGVNWGTQAAQDLHPTMVVQMLKDNNISKIKLFDSDHWTVKFFAGTGIEVMLGIPNDQLSRLTKYGNAKDWVKENVTSHMYDGGANIKYVAVGNEPFLKSYNGSHMKTTFPALQNVQKALNEAGLGDKIKATIPQNADVYDSGSDGPSAGDFRDDIRDLMVDIVTFLQDNKAPFLVNIYPFLSLYENPDFPVEFAFFDGGSRPVQDGNIQYTNMFDANLDTLAWSLKKSGTPNVKIIVGEIGWPTDGNINANTRLAQRFYNGFFRKMATKKGTPLHPGNIDVYLFSLTDENAKSIAPGSFERHWGIFGYDGKPKFALDFTGQWNSKMPVGAKNVQYLPPQWCALKAGINTSDDRIPPNIDYACRQSDCTSLGYGGSCNKIGTRGNISYAFNMYYQMNNQDVEACDFKGLAEIVKKNPSTPECPFPLALQSFGIRLNAGIVLSALTTFLVSIALF
ncbi:OLC1v1008944C1 [Oldenlandia corymbosa var. corymbosa]|uniref:glucan endo-1,3-beta-D-glucosidase n=1 Tax=Oldenlandia corymbosa var. corymbosa TaxID=529605 RepID=A0AAV1DQY0_OLDCO|nr:OLC1v1008944C1 [Oldenlandia corymbosa var. corymbosa]